MRFIVNLLFYYPLVANLLNVQAFISKFISPAIAQLFAYTNMALLLVGIAVLIKKSQKFTPIIKLWIAFYILYYMFAVFANIGLGTSISFLNTLVSVVYFLAFAFLLSDSKEIVITSKVLAVSFFASCILLLVLKYYNFSLDHDGVYEYTLERAGGVYGDANNASLAAVMSFIFVYYCLKANSNLEKLLKLFALVISAYAVFITFSKTGLVIFLLVLGLIFHKLFAPKKLLLALIFVPILIYTAFSWAESTDSLSEPQKERVKTIANIFTLNTKEVGLSDRDVLFQNMMLHVYERPILGNGIDFSNLIRGHNTIFGVWADAGILVFLLFLYILIVYFKKSFDSKYEMRFFALSILTTLFIFMMTLQTVRNQGYLMVVFVMLGYLLYQKKPFVNNK
ncbi:hypothetical protein [Aurantibacter sp.]|uniref:O-antigen ligase family protein n=1 Tax=Aurantibacter sp. TaxID=2807103 RepID=UPI003265B902